MTTAHSVTTVPARRSRQPRRRRRYPTILFCLMTLLTALALLTACSGTGNRASQSGYIDHNNDGYEDGGM
jgi:hypothetical protein